MMQSYRDFYNLNKNKIHELYTQTSHWHGTGRFHYDKSNKLIDVLEEIIKAEALKPLIKDPWLKIEGKFQKTISLAKIRMYARIYSELHQPIDKPLDYSYKSTKFWFWIIGIRQFFSSPIKIFLHLLNLQFKKGSKKQLTNLYAKFVNKDKVSNSNFISKLFNAPHTDIQNNYGIIIGIKKDSIKPLQMDSRYSLYEDRTNHEIRLAEFSYIEVPTRNYDETAEILKLYNIEIPLIPIESMEIYLSNLRLLRLLKPIKTDWY